MVKHILVNFQNSSRYGTHPNKMLTVTQLELISYTTVLNSV